MNEKLAGLIREEIVDLEQLADAIWLSQRIAGVRPVLPSEVEESPPFPRPRPPRTSPGRSDAEALDDDPAKPPPRQPDEPFDVVAPPQAPVRPIASLRSPGVPALARRAELRRALRPLGWKVPSPDRLRLVEDVTADQIARTGLWLPILEPEPELALDLVLVVDCDPRLRPWRETTRALADVARTSGFLRDVRTWTIDGHEHAALVQPGGTGSSRGPKHLLDPTGRSAIIVVSDFAGRLWREGEGLQCVRLWSRTMATTLMSLLPDRLWDRTLLGRLQTVRLSAARRNVASGSLRVMPELEPGAVPVPTILIDPISLEAWSTMIAGDARIRLGGIATLEDPSPLAAARMLARTQLRDEGVATPTHDELAARANLVLPYVEPPPPPSDDSALEHFRRTASPSVVRLAAALAVTPARLDLMRLVQASIAPTTGPLELAEILGSGLFHLRGTSTGRDDTVWFEIAADVRAKLALLGPARDSVTVLELVGRFLRDHAGGSYDFEAWMLDPDAADATMPPDEMLPFARLYLDELDRLGGRYRELARRVSGRPPPPAPTPRTPPARIAAFRDEWILVVGTSDRALTPAEASTADAVAIALAEHGFGLLTCGLDGVGKLATLSFARRLGTDAIGVTRMRHFLHKEQETFAGDIVWLSSRPEQITAAVMRSSAVLVIGGADDVKDIAAQADRRGVEVIAIAPSERGASEVIARLATRSSIVAELEDRAEEYERIRSTPERGLARTRLMDDLVASVARRAREASVSIDVIVRLYERSTAGARVVVLAYCSGAPERAPLAPVADAIFSPKSPFELWTALGAALRAVEVRSVLALEAIMTTTIAQLDAPDSLLAADPDSLARAHNLIERFAARLSYTADAESLVRSWVAASTMATRYRRSIAVIGSDKDRILGGFCRSLGQAMARRRWRISNGDGFGVGRELIAGYRELAPDSPESSRLLHAAEFSTLADMREALFEGADAVLVVGGVNGTTIEFEVARGLGLPIVPLAFTGGTAAALAAQLGIELRAAGPLLALVDRAHDDEVDAEIAVRVLASVLRVHEARKEPAPKAAPLALTDDFVLGDERQTRAWVVRTGRCTESEILGTINIFATTRQRTWLVFLPGRVLCLLDDASTRAKGRLLQFEARPTDLIPVRAEHRRDSNTMGVLAMGDHRRWLYSLRLFPAGSLLENRVTLLLQRSNEGARALTNAIAPLTSPGGFVSSYLRAVRRQTGYVASWPLGTPHAIGDVGAMKGGVFTKVTTLAALGVTPPGTETFPAADLDLQHLIRGADRSDELYNHASRVVFTATGGFRMTATNCERTVLLDLEEVSAAVVRREQAGKWDVEWHVIHEVLTAGWFGALTGTANSTVQIGLEAKGDLSNPATTITARKDEGDSLAFIGVRDCVPLIKLARLRRSFLVGPYALRPLE